MLRSLYSKFLLGYLVLGIIGYLAVMAYSRTAVWDDLVQDEASSLYREATTLSSYLSDTYETTGRPDEARARLRDASRVLETRLWLLNPEGAILYDDGGDYSGRTIDSFDPIDWSGATYRMDTLYGAFTDEQLSVCLPVVNRSALYGYLILFRSRSALLPRYNSAVDHLYLVFFIIYGLSFLLFVIFHRCVYRPLKKILSVAGEYSSGNMEQRIDVSSHDEIGRLAQTLNLTAQKVEDLDTYQRTFIANVSHDFRSPLTNIHGYVEAMRDGTIPPENSGKYLNIVQSETDRLMKLTQNLLNLNAAGSRGTILDRTTFDINSVIKTICESFEVACTEKELAFDLLFDAKRRPVYADFDKIQQVLYNLIDNAIKFSPNRETIRIETYEDGEKVFISVSDHGIGIAREDLPKIWERFYKTDASRGRDKKGSGLGLAIVKEIIEAHGEQIDCVSTEGAGSSFTFTLPAEAPEA